MTALPTPLPRAAQPPAAILKKRTIPELLARKTSPDHLATPRISMVTAYDYPTALAADRAGLDTILVGDSLGMVVLGYDSTTPVTLDEMLHHCKAARRGTTNALLIGDMPFGTYQISTDDALRNAIRMVKEAGVDAVKLEGGVARAATIRALTDAGIPVVAHIGLTPQNAVQLGGFKVQGKDQTAAQRLLDDARAVAEAGAIMLVLEAIPDRLAGRISHSVTIPTIGIGAGAECDGQVLVLHDMLGLFDRFLPKFAKSYTNLNAQMIEALAQYKTDVEAGDFPTAAHSFTIRDDVLERLY